METMIQGRGGSDQTEVLAEIVRRAQVFEVFEGDTLDQRELSEALSVSRPTAHRIVSSFEDRQFIRRVDGGYELTTLGGVVGDVGRAFEEDVSLALSLQPFFQSLGSRDLLREFDYRSFSDATITQAVPGEPYGPVVRFMDLFDSARSIRGLDPVPLNPLFVEEIYTHISAGMDVHVVFEPAVLDYLVDTDPESAAETLNLEDVRVEIHDDLPFGLSIFDDHVGIGAYDPATGILQTYIDTDDEAAFEWAESVYQRFLENATPVY